MTTEQCPLCGCRHDVGNPCKEDPDTRVAYEQIESVEHFLKQGGSRKIAIQELRRISLMLRREAHPARAVSTVAHMFGDKR